MVVLQLCDPDSEIFDLVFLATTEERVREKAKDFIRQKYFVPVGKDPLDNQVLERNRLSYIIKANVKVD